MTAVPFGRPVSSSVPVRGQDALVHPLEDPPLILRGDVYVAADDAGLPASAPLLRSATQDAALRAQGVLNHLFLLLVLVIAAAALLAALAYRRITMRFAGG